MKLGRLTIKHTKNEPFWFHKGSCGCYLVGLKFFWVEWLGEYCYCVYKSEYWKDRLVEAEKKFLK